MTETNTKPAGETVADFFERVNLENWTALPPEDAATLFLLATIGGKYLVQQQGENALVPTDH